MGFYTDFAPTNPSGQHAFDGELLQNLPGGYQYTNKQAVPDGMLVTIKKGNTIIADDVLLHFNGTDGHDILTSRVLILIADIAPLPDDLQASCLTYERVPEGYRVPRG